MPIVVTGGSVPAQTLTIDPTVEDAANIPVELIGGNVLVTTITAPAPPLDAQWSGSVDTEGDRRVSHRYRNRTIGLQVDCVTYTAFQQFEAKVAKIARYGGTLRWVLPWGEPVTFDLLQAPDFSPDFDVKFENGTTSVTVSFDAAPFGRGDPITLTDHVETTLPYLSFTEATIPGDVPAVGELLVDNDSGSTQSAYVWGLQSRFYDSASTAGLYFQAETMVGADAVAAVGPAGATGAGSNTAYASTLAALPAYSTITFHTTPTHVGSFRVLARVRLPVANTGSVTLQYLWHPDPGSDFTYNDPVVFDSGAVAPTPIEDMWLVADLGMVTIPPPLKGTPNWQGGIRAASTVAGDDLYVDWELYIPVDEGFGMGNPAIFSQTLAWRHDSVLKGSGAGPWSDLNGAEGDYLLVPCSGLEGTPVRFIIKTSRGVHANAGTSPWPSAAASIGYVAADAPDDLSAQLTVTPRYLVVPG